MGDIAEQHEDEFGGELVENTFAKWEDKADVYVPSATMQIYQCISDRLGRGKDVNVNRASSATNCPKRRQYQRKGVEGTPLTPRKLINFMMGDIAEIVTLHWVVEACVGDGKLYSEVDLGEFESEFDLNGKTIRTYKQKTLTTKIGDLVVTCHADGFGKRNSDGQWELIECKSAANWGFNDFKKSGPEDYIKQAHTVMASQEAIAMDVRSTRYFYLRKETGHLWDRLAKWDNGTWKSVAKEFLDVLKDEEIERPYGLVPEMTGRSPNKKPTGRYLAQFPCTYCPYLELCQGPHEVEFSDDQWGNKKPKQVFVKKAF